MSEYGFTQKSFTSKRTNFVFILLFVAVVFIWALVFSPDHGGLVSTICDNELRIDFVNVGQGDSMLIRTPMGRAYLVDGGTNVPASQSKRESRELIHNYLRDQGIRKLDGVVVTHWHNDHLGGINQVLSLYPVGQIWEIKSGFSSEMYKSYEEITNRKKIRRITTTDGDILDWGNELFVQVLHPDHKIRGESNTEMNNMSVVLLLRYGHVQMLLTGDIEEDAQREIVKYKNGLKTQIVKVPHHGSNTSEFRPFLKAVSAKTGIIQVGRNNPFKHPSPSVLDLYQELETQVFRNDRHGNIRLFVGGKTIEDYRFEVDRML